MPIYEYCCQSCGHEFEAMQKMSDDALSECPECNKPELKKLISAGGFQLKGDGWYETDFKNSGGGGSSSGSSSCGGGGCGSH